MADRRDRGRSPSYDPEVVGVLLLAAIVVACRTVDDSTEELERRLLELVNVEREARGLAPYSFSPELSEVARRYSALMAERGEIHHDLARPMEERVRAVLPDTCWFGENVSKHTSIDYALGDLLMSPGHRANLLSSRFTDIGVGIVRGEDGFLYITQEFARPCES